MTLPLDVPTAKPPADLLPAQAPALPLPAAPAAPTADPLPAIVEPALVAALHAVEPLPYFERMARLEPHLFFKWASLIMGQRRQGGAMQQNVINVVTAIPKSPLDELPPGFEING